MGNLGRKGFISSDISRSQSIIEGSKGKNSRQESKNMWACSLPPIKELTQSQEGTSGAMEEATCYLAYSLTQV